MNYLTALLLGVIQALTEFFPVSSSGHLAFFQQILPGFEQQGLVFDVWLHVATATAILVYYRKDLKSFLKLDLLVPLIVTTGVTGVVGLLLDDLAEKAFSSIPWVAADLIVTGLFLLLITRVREGEREGVSFLSAVMIGIAQGLAVFPGFSRSGFTIVMALFLGLRRDTAARYSFVASVPVIMLASGYELFRSGVSLAQVSVSVYLSSFAVTFVFGLLALSLFVPLVRTMRLHAFSIYCIILAGGMFLIHGYR